MKKLLLGLMVGIFLISLVSAEESNLGTFKLNECVELYQQCDNCTYVNLTSVKLPNSTNINLGLNMIKNGEDYTYTFCNTTSTGNYQYNVCGDKNGINKCEVIYFEITPNGEETNIGKSIFYIGLLAVLVFFFGLGIYSFISSKGLLIKIGMFGISYLLLIAITFISWNMANDFLTGTPFITSMLRILFFVLIAGLFPLILGGFAWYIIMLFKIKEIERLMTKGFSFEEAERRTSRRNK